LFGRHILAACDCNSVGSLDNFCDVRTGECKCRDFKYGRQCDLCQPGRWNFPVCQPCDCNGHADVCDSATGHCHNCADSTAGPHCETCLEGYYGDPVLGRNIPCRPCPCPETKATGHSFADR
jgi:coxsackievirus/adenovirus receptor